MLIMQLSDPHLRGDGKPAFRVVDTRRCLDEAVAHIKKLEQKPDLIVVTGDLADNGDIRAYHVLRDALSSIGLPIYVIPGNHDRRDRMRSIFPEWCPADERVSPYICYTLEYESPRLVMMDSMSPGSHDGHCHGPVMDWLERTLSERPDVPTLLFMHHPPIVTRLTLMDVPVENLGALAAIIRKNPQVRICCGHIHRPILGQWMERVVVTAPSISMQLELDLTPRGGDEFRMETPGYLLHHCLDGVLNTHICQIAAQASFAGPYPFVDSVNPAE